MHHVTGKEKRPERFIKVHRQIHLKVCILKELVTCNLFCPAIAVSRLCQLCFSGCRLLRSSLLYSTTSLYKGYCSAFVHIST